MLQEKQPKNPPLVISLEQFAYFGINSVPSEITRLIAMNADLRTLIDLSLCCKHWHIYLHNLKSQLVQYRTFFNGSFMLCSNKLYRQNLSEDLLRTAEYRSCLQSLNRIIIRSALKSSSGIIFQVIEPFKRDSLYGIQDILDFTSSTFLKVGYDGQITTHIKSSDGSLDLEKGISFCSRIEMFNHPALTKHKAKDRLSLLPSMEFECGLM